MSTSTTVSPTPSSSVAAAAAGVLQAGGEVQPLTDVFVPLETIQPGIDL